MGRGYRTVVLEKQVVAGKATQVIAIVHLGDRLLSRCSITISANSLRLAEDGAFDISNFHTNTNFISFSNVHFHSF